MVNRFDESGNLKCRELKIGGKQNLFSFSKNKEKFKKNLKEKKKEKKEKRKSLRCFRQKVFLTFFEESFLTTKFFCFFFWFWRNEKIELLGLGILGFYLGDFGGKIWEFVKRYFFGIVKKTFGNGKKRFFLFLENVFFEWDFVFEIYNIICLKMFLMSGVLRNGFFFFQNWSFLTTQLFHLDSSRVWFIQTWTDINCWEFYIAIIKKKYLTNEKRFCLCICTTA